jgi:hypothetical protein
MGDYGVAFKSRSFFLLRETEAFRALIDGRQELVT